MTHLTYLEAAVVGLIQGVSELFPVSSLGHNVLIPALIGGSWEADLDVASPESPYLAFIVGLHVATALALLVYFRRDWVRIIGGFGSPPAALVGGIFLGVVQSEAIVFFGAGFKNIISLTLLLIVLLFFPNGLFGGLFVSRTQAVKYALFENGHHPETIVELSRGIELDMGSQHAERHLSSSQT